MSSSSGIKASVNRAGFMLWLPDDAKKRDPKIWDISGLESGALDHPAMVIETFGHTNTTFYAILICTGSYYSRHLPIPISGHEEKSFKCKEKLCAEQPQLQYTDGSIQSKHTHVNADRAFLVSAKMLRSLLEKEWDETRVQMFRLDDRSLQIVLEKAAEAIKSLKGRKIIKELLEEREEQQDSAVYETNDKVSVAESLKLANAVNDSIKDSKAPQTIESHLKAEPSQEDIVSSTPVEKAPTYDEIKRVRLTGCLAGLF